MHTRKDTKNYVDGKKTVKVTVKEEEKPFSYRNPEGDIKQIDMKTPGTYNMMDASRAPVESGSVLEAYTRKAKPSYQVEKVEAPKVVTSTLFGAFNRVASGGTGSAVLGDPSKYPRPRKTLILYEYEGSPFWYVSWCGQKPKPQPRSRWCVFMIY
jgi:hypothetical protein